MRVLVTGSRQLLDQTPVYEALDAAYALWLSTIDDDTLPVFTVVEGGAPGADALAGQWVTDRRTLALPPELEVHPAQWGRYGRSLAGKIRNHEMVVLGADLVLAFLVPGAGNVGTRHCIQEAKTWLGFKGVPIKEIWT